MNNDWTYLSREAASSLGENGYSKLRRLAAIAHKEIRWKAYPMLTICFLSVFSMLIFAAFGINWAFTSHTRSMSLWATVRWTVIPATMLLLSGGLFLFQNHKPFATFFRLSESCYPPELEALFSRLSQGEWEAKNKNGLLPNNLFDHPWKILLAAGPEFKDLLWLLKDRKLRSYEGDIKILKNKPVAAQYQSPTTEEDGGPPKADAAKQEIYPAIEKVAMIRDADHWLAGVSRERFELGLKKYLTATCQGNPYKERVETIILQTGRHSLLEQKNQNDTIDDIILALKNNKLKCPSRSTIKVRLGGKRVIGGKKISAYFIDITQSA